ncbi:MAG: serine/threonine-protein phosphatase [Defluviicoccus sp.]|nr:serine/threonine-protein phosphatase [Defluviicoccus sp.]
MTARSPLACRQWQGARPYQEDSFGTLELAPAALLMVLADGMGGHAGGAEASRIAVDAFLRGFPGARGTVEARLRGCLAAAVSELRAREAGDRRLRGMGTTIVAALHDRRGTDWLSVGDSPMWLFAGGALLRLNADHSMAPLLAEAARSDPRRHMLRSAVTARAPELVDCGYRHGRLLPGEFLLIASDGIETLTEEEIAGHLRAAEGGVEAAADALMDGVRAAAGPHQDNATFLLLSGAEP